MKHDIPEEVIEKHRAINVFDGWWDDVYEQFHERMSKVGIHVDDMIFSGFWSQGSGACFSGYVDDIGIFMEAHGLTPDYPMTTKLVCGEGGEVDIRSYFNDHRYCHEYAADINVEVDSFKQWIADAYNSELQEAVVDALDAELENEYEGFKHDCTEIFRDYMRELHKELQNEYEYLTSDEAVIEAIVANDLYQPETKAA